MTSPLEELLRRIVREVVIEVLAEQQPPPEPARGAPPPVATLRDRLERACRTKGMSGAELARRAGLPNRQTISRIKSGDLAGRKYLERIAEVLGCDVAYLTTGKNPPAWA